MKLSEIKKDTELKQLKEEEMKQVQGGNIGIIIPIMLYAVIMYGIINVLDAK